MKKENNSDFVFENKILASSKSLELFPSKAKDKGFPKGSPTPIIRFSKPSTLFKFCLNFSTISYALIPLFSGASKNN